jgi:competence protein ComEA
MSSMAPDWRVIGGPSAPDSGASASDATRPTVSTRQLAVAATVIVALLVVGAMGALLLMPGTGGVVVDAAGADASWTSRADRAGPLTVASAEVTAELAFSPLVVDVEGAVVRPGLVSVPPGGRVGDAIELAGGFAPDVDLAAAAATINLAQEVTDGVKLLVPAIGDSAPSGGNTAASGDAPGGPVDLNRATEAQLDSLPGVGPATIAKIVAARDEAPFATIDELRSRGIVGEATFTKLRDLITVGH